jgi:hypothetical protein
MAIYVRVALTPRLPGFSPSFASVGFFTLLDRFASAIGRGRVRSDGKIGYLLFPPSTIQTRTRIRSNPFSVPYLLSSWDLARVGWLWLVG